MDYRFNNIDVPKYVEDWNSQIAVYEESWGERPVTAHDVDALEDLLLEIGSCGGEVRAERIAVQQKERELEQRLQYREGLWWDVWRLITFEDPQIRFGRRDGVKAEQAKLGQYDVLLRDYELLVGNCEERCHEMFEEYRLDEAYGDKPLRPGAIDI